MSSANKKYTSPAQTIPIVKSDIFLNQSNESLALCILSSEEVLSYKPESIAHGYLQLRANVYIDQTKMLNGNIRKIDNTESDEEDKRSMHFVILENYGEGRVAVIASMRLIIKSSEGDAPLPIEKFFPGSFVEPAPPNCTEVSRLIACHNNSRVKRTATFSVMSAGVAYAVKTKLAPVFGIVEPLLEAYLHRTGFPIKRIAEPTIIGAYNDENLGIEIDKFGFRTRLGESTIDRMMISSGSHLFISI